MKLYLNSIVYHNPPEKKRKLKSNHGHFIQVSTMLYTFCEPYLVDTSMDFFLNQYSHNRTQSGQEQEAYGRKFEIHHNMEKIFVRPRPFLSCFSNALYFPRVSLSR